MTIEELANICEATAKAIQDVQIKYEIYRDPSWPTDDIPERFHESYLIPKGHSKYEWSAIHPFTNMYLIVETAEMMNKFGDSQVVIRKKAITVKLLNTWKFLLRTVQDE